MREIKIRNKRQTKPKSLLKDKVKVRQAEQRHGDQRRQQRVLHRREHVLQRHGHAAVAVAD